MRIVRGMSRTARLWATAGTVAAVAVVTAVTVAVTSSTADNTASEAGPTTSVVGATTSDSAVGSVLDPPSAATGQGLTTAAASPTGDPVGSSSPVVELTGTGESVTAAAGQPASTGNPFDGSYEFTRTVTDDGGRPAADSVLGVTDSGSFSLVAACDAPTCAVTSPEFGSATVAASTLTFSGTAQEACPNSPDISVTDEWTRHVAGDRNGRGERRAEGDRVLRGQFRRVPSASTDATPPTTR